MRNCDCQPKILALTSDVTKMSNDVAKLAGDLMRLCGKLPARERQTIVKPNYRSLWRGAHRQHPHLPPGMRPDSYVE